MDIKYYVRTTGERQFDYDIDYDLVLDTEHKPIEYFMKALEKTDDENIVLLEDDLVLCKNFKEEIEKAIETSPDTIINFFTRPDRYFTTNYNDLFTFNQCTYFPKGIGKIVIPQMKLLRGPHHRNMYGMLLNDTLKKLGIRHLDYRPSLVQHIDGVSLLTGIRYHRHTIYFKDYLDELGIDYADAYKLENRNMLTKLLERDTKIWDSRR